jgi:lipopolysaccharide biosynthesis regulator YciM
MSATDLLIPGLAAALLLALGAALLLLRQREREVPVRARLDHEGLHPELSTGLSELVAGHPDRAIEHLREVVRDDTDAVEVYVLLGDLYRDIGQVDRALRIHRSVLNRSGLTPDQRAAATAALSRDHEKAGFLDRARAGFEEVSRLIPESARPLRHLRRLAERSADWSAALEAQQRLVAREGGDEDRKVLAYLHERVGSEAMGQGQERQARKHFEKAISTWPRCAPAHVHLGDLHRSAGRNKDAVAAWKGLAVADPQRAWLVHERLLGLRSAGIEVPGLEDWLRDIADGNPRDWRTRVVLAEHLAGTGRVDEAREVLDAALQASPGSATVQRAAWRLAAEHGVTPQQARHVADLLGDGRLTAERHACLHCRYRTNEPAWRCPHCHRWDAFVPDA